MEKVQSTLTRLRQPPQHIKAASCYEPGGEARAYNECRIFNEQPGKLQGYDCPKCKNKGVIYEPRKNELYGYWEPVAVACGCAKIREELKRRQQSGLRKLMLKYTFDTYKTWDGWQHHILTEAHRYANSLGGWFFIGGQVGCGKTHICTAIVNQLMERGKAARYMIWNEEITNIKQNVNDAAVYETLISSLKKAEILYIDDFFKTGSRSVTAADVAATFKIINHRYNEELPTIISSELSIAEIIGIDEALGSRIAEMTGGREIFISADPRKNYRYRNAKRA